MLGVPLCAAFVLALCSVSCAEPNGPGAHGAGQVTWPVPGDPDTNPYAQGLAIILRGLGHTDADYTTMMGRSGMAFALMVDLAGPKLDGVYDVAWWPNDCWAFDMRLPFLQRAFGRRLTKVVGDPKTFASDPARHYRTRFRQQVASSIRRGVPVLGQCDAARLITGHDASGAPQGIWPSPGQPAFGADRPGYPWGLVVVAGRSRKLSQAETDYESLRWAVAIGEDRAVALAGDAVTRPDITGRAEDSLFTGARAYEHWLRMLEDDTGPGRNAWDVNIVIHLCINRRAAIRYLQDVAGRSPKPRADHLRAAAALYERVLAELAEVPFWTPTETQPDRLAARRRQYTAVVRRVADLERQAIGEIKKAVAPEPEIRGVWMEQDSLALALQTAARMLGSEADYGAIACRLGVAFGPAVDLGEGCASWWHCQARLSAAALPACAGSLGLRAKLIARSDQADSARIAAVHAARVRGDVVLAEGGWDAPGLWNMAGIVTGTRPDGTLEGSPAFGAVGAVMRYPANLWAISTRSEEPSADDAAMLRLARDRILGRGRYAAGGDRRYGLAALDRMIALLRETPGYCGPCVSRGSRGWSDLPDNAKSLMGSARAAADHLAARIAALPAGARPHVERAAGLFRAISERIAPWTDARALEAMPQDLQAQRRASDEVFVPVRRAMADAAEALDRALNEM
jgi:hypothetical protein